jgi:hypothetical protein
LVLLHLQEINKLYNKIFFSKDESRWCWWCIQLSHICQQPSVKEVIGYDRCMEWFHLQCLEIQEELSNANTWFCCICRKSNKLYNNFLFPCVNIVQNT